MHFQTDSVQYVSIAVSNFWRFLFYCCFIDLQAFTLWLKELVYIHYSGFGMDLVWVGEFQIWPLY